MVLQIDELHKVMQQVDNIRNISIIAHVDHGKSTVCDSLVFAAGLINQANVGSKRFTDSLKMEQEKGITIKSSSISLLHERDSKQFLINVIDSPGHVDFSSEVSAALRVTDGALVVVDIVEGPRVQTETVLRQAIQERVKPVLFINKIDRAITELQYTPEELYQQLSKVIESVNSIIATYSSSETLFQSYELHPSKGNVCFGSGKLAFAFTLQTFAEWYAKEKGIPKEKLLKWLWGDYFYSTSGTWSTSSSSNSKRGFNQFILEPIYKLFETTSVNKAPQDALEELYQMANRLKVSLKLDEKNMPLKEQLKIVLMRFLPAAEAILRMIEDHLPSPKQAQSYRYELLYTGPLDDMYAQAIKECNPKGPLIMYISKMIPIGSEGSRFIAFGRILSGTIHSQSKVRILGPDYTVGNKEDVHEAGVQRVLLMQGAKCEPLDNCPCGNVSGLLGVDKFILKTCTIVDQEAKDCYPIKNMKYTVSPVVKIAIEPENPSDLKKLIDGMRKLSKMDSLCQCEINTETGEYLIAAAGELHLEICLNDLEENCGMKLKKKKPVVSFCETVTQKSEVCLSKSSNKHNRLFMTAEPIEKEILSLLEDKKIGPTMDPKENQKILSSFGWEIASSKKLWSFGPDNTTVLVDNTKSVDFITEIQDSVVAGFQWASKRGILCDEPVRGVKFTLVDAVAHGDAVHRNQAQVSPASRRVCYASLLKANARLMEPIYLVEIQTQKSVMGSIYTVMNKRRGTIIDTIQNPNNPLVVIQAHLPVLESFGLTEELREKTAGLAFPQCQFSHWQLIDEDPFDTKSIAHKIVMEVRKNKSLNMTMPDINDYLDRL